MRISKRIVTTTRTIEVPVRIEQLVIAHEPLQEPLREPLQEQLQQVVAESDPTTLPDGDRSATTGDDLVIVLHEEVPEVTLRVVAVEQVRVGKRSVLGEQTLSVELAAETAEVTTSAVTTSDITTPDSTTPDVTV